jgi:hypothetical protein
MMLQTMPSEVRGQTTIEENRLFHTTDWPGHWVGALALASRSSIPANHRIRYSKNHRPWLMWLFLRSYFVTPHDVADELSKVWTSLIQDNFTFKVELCKYKPLQQTYLDVSKLSQEFQIFKKLWWLNPPTETDHFT